MNESDPIQEARIFDLDDIRPLALRTLREMLQPIRKRQRKGRWTRVSDVHEARVEVRRMRATLGLFAPMLETEKSERLERKLRRIVRGLGPVRDLDVLVERSLRWSFPRRGEALVELIYQISAERERLVAGMKHEPFLSAEDAEMKIGGGMLTKHPVSGTDWRHKLEAGILADLQGLDGGLESDELASSEAMKQLHERRKRCRHLRYQLEFLQPATASDLGIRFFRSAQMRLGRVQDAAVIREWFRGAWKERVRPKLLVDILAWEEAELSTALRELQDFWNGTEGWAAAKVCVERALC